MILNKEILIKAIEEKIYDEACFDGEKPLEIEGLDELHDIALLCRIGDDLIEEYDEMYYEMLIIIQQNEKEIIDEINDYIDEEFQPCYMGEPAFASAGDYWSYILG